ncbi:SH3 domain-containing protein Dlish-like [Nematostella vectensis]|uniref:SH3 domain-containing protein Dlish-like n=1 Tax=Nematostella vectensis TaxID=45351 RepID=UPI002076F1B2|nr:SH3 domain-containing protein Dlish-like [Nematostella vectensis]
MAFLCPMRIPRRRRKRKGADEKNTLQNGAPKNRITGSSSLDSLVGIVKQEDEDYFADDPKKMVVTHDFIPCVDDELAVKRGERVLMLYRQNNWYYIKNSRNSEGFIPFTNCIAEDEYEKRQNKLSRQNIIRNTSFLDSMDSSIYPGQKVSVFMKKNFGEFVALWDFNATAEDDITASKGDVVTVLNKDDPDWYWVVKRSGDEGFIPKEFIIPADQLSVKCASHSSNSSTTTSSQDSPHTPHLTTSVPYAQMDNHTSKNNLSSKVNPLATRKDALTTKSNASVSYIESFGVVETPGSINALATTIGMATPIDSMTKQMDSMSIDTVKYTPLAPLACQPATASRLNSAGRSRRNSNDLMIYGQDLVCTDTYTAQQDNELTVFKGDWVYADMQQRDARGWIWAYSPASHKQGYVPRACLRPPATTPL